jgi:diguanylate cyclase (GGDEF)-like protein
MQLVLQATGAQRAVLFLSREGKLMAEAEGQTDQARVLQNLPLDNLTNIPHAVVRYVARTRERLIIDDATRAEPYRSDPYLARSRPLSLLCVPIVHQGELAGVIYCENELATGSFNDSRAHVVSILASQVALAVKQAESVIDTLTRLWMRGYFMDRAGAELARRKQEGSGCTLLILDLDHFKQKNDTLGHQGGDLILREVSRRISNTLRPTDLVGRYGGEELVVLLPGTKRDQASMVADRIRRAVAAPLAVEAGKDVVQTVSIGLASLPQNGVSLEELIGAADRALYQAKHGGRNRVVEA